jgi:steroid 5-alpha reductase family enzyme
MNPKNRLLSFVIIAILYISAALLGISVYNSLPFVPWLSLLIADLVATLFIWLASLLLRNASVYDPYWSVQPLVILGLMLFKTAEFDAGSIIFIVVIAFWSLRLTGNWVVTFPGMHQQDWRYDQLQEKSGRFFPLVNLVGIQVMPTLIVFACLLPGFYYLMLGGGMNFWTWVGLLVSLGGTVLELSADAQMLVFRKQNTDPSRLIRTGLWRHSRHPNYLGEIMMWWGVYLVLLSVQPHLWLTGLGALINTCLFLFISVPLAEKRLAGYKDGFEKYKKETRMFLPIPKHAR